MLKLIARLLSRPRIAAWIIKHGQRYEYFHLEGYMRRWWLMPRCLLYVNSAGVLFPRAWLPFCIRLHHIQQPDAGQVLHDHPANYRTIILKGGYTEIRLHKPVRYLKAGDTEAAKATQFHRIDWVTNAGVWTIFIMGRRRQTWGFLTKGVDGNYRKIQWREYVLRLKSNEQIHQSVSELLSRPRDVSR